MTKSKIVTILLLVFFSLLIYSNIQAQNTMSPYSIFGSGEIISKGFGRNIGMGGAGIAIPSNNHLNNLNPASYAGIEKQHFIYEIGADVKYSDFKTYDESLSGLNGSLKYLALGFRYTDWLSTSLGLSPYSSVGYKIRTESSMDGALLNYQSDFEGSGGITLAYWTNTLKISRNLSVGVNTSFLFGSLTQQETITQSDFGIGYTLVQNDYVSSAYFDFGLQYSFNINKMDFGIGLIYAPEQSIKSEHSFTLTDASLNTLDEEEGGTGNLTIPENTGVGISIQNPDKYLIAIDYRTEKWQDLRYPNMSGNFVNSHNFLAGIEFEPWKESFTNNFYQNWTYRAGFNYNTSYLKIKNNTISGYAFDLGIGIPLKNRQSTMNVAFEIGSNGTTSDNLIKERYYLMHLNFSINELWFFKKKIY